MAVRDALLTLLLPGPRYGFQLHGELAERTGGRRAVNVGQTYATLDRLGKQGLVEPAGATDDGLPLYRLTRDGRTAAHGWLDGADAAGADAWDETVERVLIARSLDARGVDATSIGAAERARWAARVAEAEAVLARLGEPTITPDAAPDHAAAGDSAVGAGGASAPSDGPATVRLLAASADLHRGRAAIAWLDAALARPAVPWASSAERPKRGRRPVRSSAPDAPGTDG